MHRSLPRSVPAATPPAPAPRVHVLAPRSALDLCAELASRGAAVQAHADLPSLLAALEEHPSARIVLAVEAERSRELLAAAAALRRLHASAPLVLVIDEAPPCATWRKAATLTSACFPAGLEASVVAQLALDHGAVEPEALPASAPEPRHLVLTLWESLAVDDRQVYLGVAERNFLFTLALRPGVRLAKSSLIEAGPGRHLSAAACRRRLGQRLGPELAELLVPQERFEPYRLREPAEVEAISSRRGLGRVTLRIVGRASVRMVPAAAGFG